MKICIVLPDILPVPSTKGGAIETLVNHIADQNEILNSEDITIVSVFDKEAYVISQNYSKTKFHFIKNNTIIRYLFVVIRKIINLGRKMFEKSPMIFTLYVTKLYFFLKRNEFDIIVIEGSKMKLFRPISRLVGKNKMVYHFHGGNFNLPNNYPKDFHGIFDNYIAVSNYIRNSAIKNGDINPSSIYMLLNCVDLSIFNPKRVDKAMQKSLRENLNILEDDFIVLFVGRIIPYKGVKELIEAIKLINNPKVKLLILGSVNFALKAKSKYHNEVLQLINDHPSKILHTGYIDNSEVYKYHIVANIFVMPSTYEEPCGLVLFEAMAMGVPIIATRSGGIPEVVDKDCAIIMEKENNLIQNLANAIIELMSDKTLKNKMSIHGRARSQKFGMKEFYNGYIKILNDVKKKNDVDA